MPVSSSTVDTSKIDIESIVRLVLRRLTNETVVPLQQRVIDVAAVESLSKDVQTVEPSLNSIITPAAKDELRLRGIGIRVGHSGSVPVEPPSIHPSAESALTADPGQCELAGVIQQQLVRRGVSMAFVDRARIHLSIDPASALISFIRSGSSAVLINRLSDIPRFTHAACPSVYVLDAGTLNFMELVNAAAAIAKTVSAIRPGDTA